MVGIKETKEVLAFAMSLHMMYDQAKADGKIDMNDVGLIILPVTKLIPAIDNIKAVSEEIKDLDAAEKAELDAWIKQEYDIADDELEAKIEKGLSLVLSLAEFVGAL